VSCPVRPAVDGRQKGRLSGLSVLFDLILTFHTKVRNGCGGFGFPFHTTTPQGVRSGGDESEGENTGVSGSKISPGRPSDMD